MVTKKIVDLITDLHAAPRFKRQSKRHAWTSKWQCFWHDLWWWWGGRAGKKWIKYLKFGFLWGNL